MATREIMFFSTLSDIEFILKCVEEKFPVQYFEMGSFETPQIPHYNSIFEVSNLGYPIFGNWNRDTRFLIIAREDTFKFKEVPQRKGGIRYYVDQNTNPKSCGLQVGGVFKEGVLIAGTFNSTYRDDFSIGVYKLFSSMMKKIFKKIGGKAYVGPEAFEKLKLGWRLVTDVSFAEEYDFKYKG